jgi:hypothetical protein
MFLVHALDKSFVRAVFVGFATWFRMATKADSI